MIVFLRLLLLLTLCIVFEQPCKAEDNSRSKTVAVVGGGIAGLTAAHILSENGFRVILIEKQSIAGGLARSDWEVKDKKKLFKEVSWRVTSSNYYNFHRIMKSIPAAEILRTEAGHHTVFDQLKKLQLAEILRYSEDKAKYSQNDPFDVVISYTYGLSDHAFSQTWSLLQAFHPWEIYKIASVAFFSLTSCRERVQSFSDMTYSALMELDRFSNFSRHVLHGFLPVVFGVDEERTSARIALDFIACLFGDYANNGAEVQLFGGPTKDVLFDPWVKYLKEQKNVDIRFDSEVKSLIHSNSGKPTSTVSLTYTNGGILNNIEADHVVIATPVRATAKLLQMESLKVLDGISAQYMNTLSLHFSEYVLPPGRRGSVSWYTSPWTPLLLPHDAFWQPCFTKMTSSKQVLSVSAVLSNRTGVLYNKTALECTQSEFLDELLEQTGLAWARHLLVGVTYSPQFKYDSIGVPSDMFGEPKYSNNAGTDALVPDYKLLASNGVILAGGWASSVRNYGFYNMEGAVVSGIHAADAILEANNRQPYGTRQWQPPITWLDTIRSFDKLLYRFSLSFEILFRSVLIVVMSLSLWTWKSSASANTKTRLG
jgi:hypothetical protein